MAAPAWTCSTEAICCLLCKLLYLSSLRCCALLELLLPITYCDIVLHTISCRREDEAPDNAQNALPDIASQGGKQPCSSMEMVCLDYWANTSPLPNNGLTQQGLDATLQYGHLEEGCDPAFLHSPCLETLTSGLRPFRYNWKCDDRVGQPPQIAHPDDCPSNTECRAKGGCESTGRGANLVLSNALLEVLVLDCSDEGLGSAFPDKGHGATAPAGSRQPTAQGTCLLLYSYQSLQLITAAMIQIPAWTATGRSCGG